MRAVVVCLALFTPPTFASADEKSDLIAFLRSLTDSTFLTDPRFSNPWIK